MGNGYAFCGMSIINEYANDGDLHYYLKHHYNDKKNPMKSIDKLVLARDSSFGLRDIHGIDNKDSSNINRATLLHRDIRPHNFLVINDKLKFHDFNNAQLLLKNPYPNDDYHSFGRDGESCTKTESEVYPKAPEECIFPQNNISEKMEIYRLGVFFFKLLTGDLPYKFELDDNNNHQEQQEPPLSTVLQWILDKDRIPKIPLDIEKEIEKDPSMKVLMMVMRNCTQYNPDLRPSANELSIILNSAANRITNDSS